MTFNCRLLNLTLFQHGDGTAVLGMPTVLSAPALTATSTACMLCLLLGGESAAIGALLCIALALSVLELLASSMKTQEPGVYVPYLLRFRLEHFNAAFACCTRATIKLRHSYLLPPCNRRHPVQAPPTSWSSHVLSDHLDSLTVETAAVLAWSLIARQMFFSSGHQVCRFRVRQAMTAQATQPMLVHIRWLSGLVGLNDMQLIVSGVLVYVDTFGAYIIMGLALPLLVTWRHGRHVRISTLRMAIRSYYAALRDHLHRPLIRRSTASMACTRGTAQSCGGK